MERLLCKTIFFPSILMRKTLILDIFLKKTLTIFWILLLRSEQRLSEEQYLTKILGIISDLVNLSEHHFDLMFKGTKTTFWQLKTVILALK